MLPLIHETDDLIRKAKEERGQTKEDYLSFLSAKIEEYLQENETPLPRSYSLREWGDPPRHHDDGLLYSRLIFRDLTREEWETRIVEPAIGSYYFGRKMHTLNHGVVNYWIYDFLVFTPGLRADDVFLNAVRDDFPNPSEKYIERENINRTGNATEELMICTTLPVEGTWDYRTMRELFWAILFQKGYPIDLASGLPSANRKAFNDFNKIHPANLDLLNYR